MSPDDEAVELVLLLGQALHRHGATSPRLEEALTEVSRALGLEARFFSTPTAVIASFGAAALGRTCLVRVEPGEIHLEKLALLDAVAEAVAVERVGAAEGRRRVEAAMARPQPYGPGLTLACYGMASAASAVFFRGAAADVAGSAAAGACVGLVVTRAYRREGFARLQDALAAAVAAALAAAVAHAAPGASPSVITLSGIVSLLPGLSVTSAMNELAARHLASGTARLAGAAASLLGLGFGVAVGGRLGRLLPPAAAARPHAWPAPAVAGAVAVASMAFMVLLRARRRDAPVVLAAGAVAYGSAALGERLLGPSLGAFTGAFALALGSNLYARRALGPALVPLVPGILLLVPGSVGFRGVLSMLDRDVVPAVDASFVMITVAASLAAGLLAAAVALPPRSAL